MLTGRGPDLEALGTLIRERRMALGLTQQQLGERIGWVQERISLLEHGRYGLPSLPALDQIARAIEQPLAEVLAIVGYDTRGFTPERGRPETTNALLYTLPRLLAIEAIDLHVALTEAADILVDSVAADKVDVFCYDPESDSLVALGTSRTAMGELQKEVGLDRLPLSGGGRMVEVFQTGEAYVSGHSDEDPGELPAWRDLLRVRSAIDVPLVVAGERRGVLAAAASQPEKFSADDVAFFQAVASWIGLLAHRADLVAAQTERAAEAGRHGGAEELLRVWAHDVQNLLTPLRGRIDLIRRRAEKEGRERDFADAEAASRAFQRLHQVTNRLLDVTYLERGLTDLSVPAVDPEMSSEPE